MRVRGKLWRSFGSKRRREREKNVAVDPILPAAAAAAYSDSDLNVEPPQLIVAPMTEETITLYAAAPSPHSSEDASEKVTGDTKVRKSIGNREIVMEDAKTVRVKVMRGQQEMRRLHLYNEDEEEEKQRRKVEEEEERKRVEAERRRVKGEEEEQRTRRNSSSHQFPSSVRAECLYFDNVAS